MFGSLRCVEAVRWMLQTGVQWMLVVLLVVVAVCVCLMQMLQMKWMKPIEMVLLLNV